MIGHRKFAWKVENLTPPEWFDLDRSEKPMSDEVPSHEEHFDFEKWETVDCRCQNCGEPETQITGVVWEDEFDERIANIMKCGTCGKIWKDWEIGWGDDD